MVKSEVQTFDLEESFRKEVNRIKQIIKPPLRTWGGL